MARLRGLSYFIRLAAYARLCLYTVVAEDGLYIALLCAAYEAQKIEKYVHSSIPL